MKPPRRVFPIGAFTGSARILHPAGRCASSCEAAACLLDSSGSQQPSRFPPDNVFSRTLFRA